MSGGDKKLLDDFEKAVRAHQWFAALSNSKSTDELRELEAIAKAARKALADRISEADERQVVFDLRWKAYVRAIARWREEKLGRELTLLDRIEALERELKSAREFKESTGDPNDDWEMDCGAGGA